MSNFRLQLESELRADKLRVSADAARLLGELNSTESISDLMQWVQESKRYEKSAGLAALAGMGDPRCGEHLAELAEKPGVPNDWYWYGAKGVQVAAAIAAYCCQEKEAIELLVPIAEESHDALMVWYGPTMLQLMQDDTQLMERFGEYINVGTLFQNSKGKLDKTRLSDPSRLIKLIESLQYMTSEQKDDARSIARGYTQFHSRFVRAMAYETLGVLGDPAPNLEQVDHEITSADKIGVLRGLMHHESFNDEELLDLLHDENRWVRWRTCESIGIWKRSGCYNAMEALLDDEDAMIRHAAAYAFFLAQVECAELRKKLLDDNNNLVRLQALAWSMRMEVAA